MDNYVELECKFSGGDEQSGIITAFLSELGFEMFEEVSEGLLAYIPQISFLEEDVKKLSADIHFSFSVKIIQGKNWNEEWERNFPVLVHKNIFSIRAPFHDMPEGIKYNLKIEPDMSFGTGHHPTTFMMLEEMMGMDFAGKRVLDMGAGTGILSIMASLMGAAEIFAVENNERSYQNILLNIKHNGLTNVTAGYGSTELLTNKNVDFILANLNRNILIDQMETYFKILKKGGYLLMSGFFEEDIPMLIESPGNKGFSKFFHRVKDQWAILSCGK